MAIGLLPITVVLGEPPVSYGVPALTTGLSGGYHAVSSGGYQSNEGLDIDPHLLHKIKSIILDSEIQEEEHRSHSSIYQPSSAYGPPQYHHGGGGRISGIHFGGIRPSIQVAQFHQQSHEYNAGGHQSYYAPSHSYGAPAPSHSYGAPSSVGFTAPSIGYSVPSAPAYLAPPPPVYSRPSPAYGAPSASYGPPIAISPRFIHHHRH